MLVLEHELENFSPIDLDNLLLSHPDITDNLKKSVLLYNKALDSLKQNNEDMAVIELKKAIALNPDFHEAMNLLGLCHVCMNEYEKAAEMFERVMAAENNSIKAMNYLNTIAPGSVSINSESKPKNRKQKPVPIPKNTENRSPFIPQGVSVNISNWKMDLLRLAAGIAVGVVIGLMINFFGSNKIDNYVSASNDTTDKTQTSAGSISYEKEYKDLEEKYKALDSDLAAANQQIDYYNNVLKLFEVEKLAAAGEYEKAGELLVLLKGITFNGLEGEKFNKLYSGVIPKVALDVLNEGTRLMKSKRYQEALDMLSKAQVFGDDVPNMDRILYNIGKCNIELQDAKSAVAAFQSVIEKYPESRYAKYSETWINSLTKQP